MRKWAEDNARRWARRPGVLGVVIGGSIARGQEWKHSDLELGLLVDAKLDGLGHFNTDQGRGVEIFQLVRSEIEPLVARVEAGETAPVLKWPIQLWRCRVVDDPSGLLARYKTCFDRHLFSPALVRTRVAEMVEKTRKSAAGVREWALSGRELDALQAARWIMNDVILALHWAHGELPRSQNRTDSRFRTLCKRHGLMDAYQVYRDIFGLDGANRVIRTRWPEVRDEVLELTRAWGDAARDFFQQAVDSEFGWGQNAGILSVYRLYVPGMGGERSVISRLKAGDLALRPSVVEFFGLDRCEPERVAAMADGLDRCIAIAERRLIG